MLGVADVHVFPLEIGDVIKNQDRDRQILCLYLFLGTFRLRDFFL